LLSKSIKCRVLAALCPPVISDGKYGSSCYNIYKRSVPRAWPQ